MRNDALAFKPTRVERGSKLTYTAPMSDVADLDTDLNRMLAAGHGLAAFEKHYADDCVMRENDGDPREGKALNRKYQDELWSSIATFHEGRLLASAVDEDVSFSEWELEVTFRGGERVTMAQVARRRWRNGKVVDERFYYRA